MRTWAVLAFSLLGLAVSGCASAAEDNSSSPPDIGVPDSLGLPASGFVQGGLVIGKAKPGDVVELDGERVMVGPDGLFVFGFDRDAPLTSRLWVGSPLHETYYVANIKPRKFDIQRIDGLPEAQVTPPRETQARIAREAKLKAAARKKDTQGSWFAEKFIWPASGRISGVFGSQRILNGQARAPHYGLDVAAPEGAPIVAPAGGIVTLAEPDLYFEGGIVFIDHGHGLISYLMHMSKVEAHVGQELKQGDRIGLVGKTGRATAAHLHWGMFWLKEHIDPQLLVPPLPAPPAAN